VLFWFDEWRLVLESKLHHRLVQIKLHTLLHLDRIKKTEDLRTEAVLLTSLVSPYSNTTCPHTITIIASVWCVFRKL